MIINKFIHEDISQFEYFMKEEDIQKYQRNKIICCLIPLPFAILFYHYWYIILMLCALCYKIPYFLLKSEHIGNCNKIVDAVPIWIGTIYALVESNTIHNAIVNSLGASTPPILKKELQDLIAKIDKDPNDKDAYMNFLSKYEIDGFLDIMLKFYEYRNLSKDKLKYELKNLNKDLGKFESLKRKNRFESEMRTADLMASVMFFIASIYLTLLFMSPHLLSM